MSTLYKKTLDLLEKSELSLREIEERSGLPYNWLVSIRYDRVNNPSVNRIETLYEFLSGSKLSV